MTAVLAHDAFAAALGSGRGRPDMHAAVRADQLPGVREEAERLMRCDMTLTTAADLSELITAYPEIAAERLPEGSESSVAERLTIRYVDCHLHRQRDRMTRLAYALGISDLDATPRDLDRSYRAFAVREQLPRLADVIAAAGPALHDRANDRTRWLLGEAFAHVTADYIIGREGESDGRPSNTRHLLRLADSEPFVDHDAMLETARLAHHLGADSDIEQVDKLAAHIGPHLRDLVAGNSDFAAFADIERIPAA